MSSSRSIAAARNRRSNETSIKPTQQPRPVTSISSQSAFTNQNMRTQNQPALQKPPSNGLPFSKLSVSDAIGLVTLRLGRVEQFIIDSQETQGGGGNIPENTRIIDNSVLTSMINRIDSLEKKEQNAPSHHLQIGNLEKELANIKSIVSNLTNELNAFITNANDKFRDYENALIEIENATMPHLEDVYDDNNAEIEIESDDNGDVNNINNDTNENITMSTDL